MYISALRVLPLNFGKIVWTNPENALTERELGDLNFFEHNSDRFKKIGEGKSATVHEFVPEKYVVKRTKYFRTKLFDNFKNETEALMLIPDTFEHTQRLVANTRSEVGRYFLITTFQKGSPANIYSQPLNTQRMKATLDSVFELDKAGIYHMDLNNNNILLDGDSANIIDYQWAKPFKPFNATEENQKNGILFPEKIIPANIQNYEETGFSSYLSKYMGIYPTEQTRDFIKNYLSVKADYFNRRVHYFKNALIEKGEYYTEDEETGEKVHKKEYYTPLKLERALSKVYSAPNDDVVDVELLRLEVLRSHRKSYSFIDPNIDKKNINMLNSAPYTINAVFAVKNFLFNLDRLEKKYENDKYMSRYLRYNRIIAEYWKANISSWYPQTLRYLSELADGKTDQILYPDRNYIRYFSLKTFDKLLSPEAQRNNPQNITLKMPASIEEMFPNIQERINKLKAMDNYAVVKNHYTESDWLHVEKREYTFKMGEMADDIQLAFDKFKYALSSGKPADAFSALLVMKNLCSQLQIRDNVLIPYEVYRAPHEAGCIESSLNEIVNIMIMCIMDTLSSKDRPVRQGYDMQLTQITRAVPETPQNKSLIDKIVEWWESL